MIYEEQKHHLQIPERKWLPNQALGSQNGFECTISSQPFLDKPQKPNQIGKPVCVSFFSSPNSKYFKTMLSPLPQMMEAISNSNNPIRQLGKIVT